VAISRKPSIKTADWLGFTSDFGPEVWSREHYSIDFLEGK
jgi:hypothetical protein